MSNGAGTLDVVIDNCLLKGVTPDEANKAVFGNPLGLIGCTKRGTQTILLAENILGYNLRADQFVYRMNPGISTTPQQPRGETAEVVFYVTQFGQAASGVELQVYKLCQAAAIKYTRGTLGTGGTLGIKNLSVPQAALKLSDPTSPNIIDETAIANITTDKNGIARLNLQASDPGNPRGDQNVDGQVYFIKYNFADDQISASFVQDANDLISVQVYSDPAIPQNPTWENCIKQILPQYGKLYPIMGRFQLDNYQSVYNNRIAIKTVLSKPMEDALHMPVIRDLSIKRTNAIIDWIDNGALGNL